MVCRLAQLQSFCEGSKVPATPPHLAGIRDEHVAFAVHRDALRHHQLRAGAAAPPALEEVASRSRQPGGQAAPALRLERQSRCCCMQG